VPVVLIVPKTSVLYLQTLCIVCGHGIVSEHGYVIMYICCCICYYVCMVLGVCCSYYGCVLLFYQVGAASGGCSNQFIHGAAISSYMVLQSVHTSLISQHQIT
jgi:hypothetical protein